MLLRNTLCYGRLNWWQCGAAGGGTLQQLITAVRRHSTEQPLADAAGVIKHTCLHTARVHHHATTALLLSASAPAPPPQDPQDQGAGYRNVVGLPGGMDSPLFKILQEENVNKMKLLQGQGNR